MNFYKFIFILLFTVLFAHGVFAQEYEKAEECQKCHSQLYKQWYKSRHGKAGGQNNPFYRTMLKKSALADAESVSECKRCHEPVTALNLSEILVDNLGNEGISCDVCHATKIFNQNGVNWLRLDKNNTKYGPFKDAVATTHKHEYSKEHLNSDFCMICHSNKKLPHGITFIDLDKEYKSSHFYDLGITCQDCHMPAMKGKTASLGKIRDEIYNHRFWGGYEQEILTDCASLELTLSVQNDQIELSIKVKNVTVGHALPTASPLRMVLLDVVAMDELNQVIWKNYYINPIKEDQQAIFMKLFEDATGKAPAAPWNASGQRFDSRLMPDEVRVLNYKIPKQRIKRIKADLKYYIAPPPLLRELDITQSEYTGEKLIVTREITL